MTFKGYFESLQIMRFVTVTLSCIVSEILRVDSRKSRIYWRTSSEFYNDVYYYTLCLNKNVPLFL